MSKFRMHKKGQSAIIGGTISAIIGVIVVVNLIPTLVTAIADAQNLTTAETALLNIISTLIIVSLVVGVVVGTGLIKRLK